MRQHLRVLLLGTAMLFGTGALAVAQPGTGSGERGHGYHHGGMDAPRGPMMSRHGYDRGQGYDRDQRYDQDYGRTNQRGYGASPYHGPHPDYHSDPGYRSGDQQGRWSHPHGHAHGFHHQYDDHDTSHYGHGGWDRLRGPHSRSGHAHGYGHHHGDYGPQRRGDRRHYDGDRRDRHSEMRARSTRDAMGFHGMRIDTNDDGVISPDEAAAHAEMIFVLLDRNMDGVLSRDDRGKREHSRDRDDRRGTEQPRRARGDQQSRQAEEADNEESVQRSQAQSNGQSSGPQSGQEDQRRSQRGQVFSDMDQDGDGRVTMEEFMSFHEERYNELAGDEGEVSPWRYRASWHGFSSDE